MGLMPKRVKYRKSQRGRRKGTSFAGSELSFGEYGLKALGNTWIKDRQIVSLEAIDQDRVETIDATGLVVSPGAGYGHCGEGFFRLSLTTADEVIDTALERLAGFVKA